MKKLSSNYRNLFQVEFKFSGKNGPIEIPNLSESVLAISHSANSIQENLLITFGISNDEYPIYNFILELKKLIPSGVSSDNFPIKGKIIVKHYDRTGKIYYVRTYENAFINVHEEFIKLFDDLNYRFNTFPDIKIPFAYDHMQHEIEENL